MTRSASPRSCSSARCSPSPPARPSPSPPRRRAARPPAPRARRPPTTPTTASSASPTSNSAVPDALMAPTPSPSASASPAATPSPAASGATPTDPTDLAWITPEIQQQFDALDCSDPTALENIVDDPTKPLVTCDVDGAAKYILGPVAVSGDKISDATSGYRTNQQGAVTSEVEIALTLNGEGAEQYADISRTMVALPEPQNQLAATLDSRSSSRRASTRRSSTAGASITGGFTLESARSLSDQLKFGALPLSFVEQTEHRHQPHAGQRAAALRPDRRPDRPVPRRRLLAAAVPRAGPRHGRVDPRGRPAHLPDHHDPGLVAQLPPRHGRRDRSDRRHRFHRRLVHRLLRADP